MSSRTSIFFYLLILILLSSCGNTKNISYFQTEHDTVFNIIPDTIEAPIQKKDILNISISSLNKAASADFNANDENVQGYLVNNDGNIQLPTLGSVSAYGLTKSQLKEKITRTILDRGLLLDPIVSIRHLNFEVTVLGEVAKPSVINVPSEQISLVKALGLAGDLTIYGKRDNILLIREENGKRSTTRININSVDFLNSPYYYLKPNDMIYVEPNKTKIAASEKTLLLIPVIISSISVLILIWGTFLD